MWTSGSPRAWWEGCGPVVHLLPREVHNDRCYSTQNRGNPMAKKPIVSVLTAAVLLTRVCVVMPTAPSIVAMPGSQKSFDQFRADEDASRGYTESARGGSGAESA